MSTDGLTRRAAFAILGAVAVAMAASDGALARRAREVAHPGIRVDVEPLRANAGDPTATWVAEFLPGQLAQELAQRGAHADVSVQIDYLTLGSNTGGIGPAGSSYDTIQGVARINGAEMPVRATNSYYPSPVDQTMIEQSNRIRVQQLTQALAYWVAQDAAR
jgi:hypothetical protein